MPLTQHVLPLLVCGCVATFVAAVLHAIAFGTRFWLQSDGRSPFQNIGFHEVCFDECQSPYCPGVDSAYVYSGCWWIYNEYLRELWLWIRQPWYMTLRNLTIINVPLSFCAWILSLICLMSFMATRYALATKPRVVVASVLFAITAVFMAISGIMCIVVCGQFSLRAFYYGWMPLPYKNHLGYSFWFEVVAGILLVLSFAQYIAAAIFRSLDFGREPVPVMSDDIVLGKH